MNEEQRKWVISEKEEVSKIKLDVQDIYGTNDYQRDPFSMNYKMQLAQNYMKFGIQRQ